MPLRDHLWRACPVLLLSRVFTLRSEKCGPRAGCFECQPYCVCRREKSSSLTKKSLAVAGIVFAGTLGLAPAASATIHPIVESYDCASDTAFANHPLGDVAEVPGVTPGYGSHSTNSDLASLSATSDGFTDFSSPAWSDFKLNGVCGQVGR